jgi:hypothetical protein
MSETRAPSKTKKLLVDEVKSLLNAVEDDYEIYLHLDAFRYYEESIEYLIEKRREEKARGE